MSKARVIVLSVVHQHLTKAETARKFGVSWQWVHTLVTRYEAGGLDALELRSSRFIDADKSYWRDQNKEPGRWPSSS